MYGVIRVGWPLVPFMVAGPVLVIAYNAELLQRRRPQRHRVRGGLGRVPGADRLRGRRPARWPWRRCWRPGAALGLSAAQRSLSTPARLLRRKSGSVTGQVVAGRRRQVLELDRARLLAPLEQALRAMSWGMVLLAAALAVARLR